MGQAPLRVRELKRASGNLAYRASSRLSMSSGSWNNTRPGALYYVLYVLYYITYYTARII